MVFVSQTLGFWNVPCFKNAQGFVRPAEEELLYFLKALSVQGSLGPSHGSRGISNRICANCTEP